MAYKKYGYEPFFATVNGVDYSFYCHGENTRYGFRHVCDVHKHGMIRAHVSQSYYNRTWERFTYETVLAKAIDHCPPEDRAELRARLIDRTAEAEHERCEAELANFKALYDQQTPGMKKALASVTLQSEDDVKFVTGVMKAATILNSIK